MIFKPNRPTSPHLQVYKLPLTGIISISHRITGVLLCSGFVFIILFLYALSQGEAAYAIMQGLSHHWLLRLAFWGFVFALFFHGCHGIRHLLWDLGKGFEADLLFRYALAELIVATVLTLITWLLF